MRLDNAHVYMDQAAGAKHMFLWADSDVIERMSLEQFMARYDAHSPLVFVNDKNLFTGDSRRTRDKRNAQVREWVRARGHQLRGVEPKLVAKQRAILNAKKSDATDLRLLQALYRGGCPWTDGLAPVQKNSLDQKEAVMQRAEDLTPEEVGAFDAVLEQVPDLVPLFRRECSTRHKCFTSRARHCLNTNLYALCLVEFPLATSRDNLMTRLGLHGQVHNFAHALFMARTFKLCLCGAPVSKSGKSPAIPHRRSLSNQFRRLWRLWQGQSSFPSWDNGVSLAAA